MLRSLARKRTAHSAWEAVKTVHIDVQCVHDANAKQLLKEFNDITFKVEESVANQVRITGLGNQVRILGWNITDDEVVTKMLEAVLEHLSQVAIANCNCN